MTETTAFWRRLDVPGHDACRLSRHGDGWQLSGVAAFRDPAGPAHLTYTLTCDAQWRSVQGIVRGWIGDLAVDTTLVRDGSSRWTANGTPIGGVDDLDDIDYGFTPATNLPHLRRVALGIGVSADVPVLWFDPSSGTLGRLRQHYRRIAADRYAYHAPDVPYAAELVMGADGFAIDYPELWVAER